MDTSNEFPKSTDNLMGDEISTIEKLKELSERDAAQCFKYGFNVSLDFVEYLITEDVFLSNTDDMSALPERRALQYLVSLADIFGVNPQTFRRGLFLKHGLSSLMGRHFIFGLRILGVELDLHTFVVHMDSQQRIRMITCTYIKGMYNAALTYSQSASVNFTELLKQVVKFIDAKKIKNVVVQPLIIKVKNKGKVSISIGLQTKSTSEKRGGVVAHYYPDLANAEQVNSKNIRRTTVYAYEMGLGKIFKDFHPPLAETLPADKSVILRDLELGCELRGRYVAIRNSKQIIWKDYNYQYDFPSDDLMFDRCMAYYHVDLIQRYFREIGIQALDEYPQCNPMLITFVPAENGSSRTHFNNEIFSIIIAQYSDCTDARQPKILYHEFTHVVIDALARLHRNPDQDSKSSRYYMYYLQAAAIDEAMADYFACSLAARHGDPRAIFYPSANSLAQSSERCLENSYTTDFSVNENTNEYTLANEWSKFLWGLRVELGVEIADMLIANSIFFLSRWSTFRLAYQALLLTNDLLFHNNSDNQHKIEAQWALFKSSITITEPVIEYSTDFNRREKDNSNMSQY